MLFSELSIGVSTQTPALGTMSSSAMLCRVALVRTDVSEELSASIIRVTRIGELGTALVVTSNGQISLLHISNVKCFPLCSSGLLIAITVDFVARNNLRN
jgi:demethoxyubiquinone hydroxylase (CLK1/Coq7/Cat5 family)